MVDTFVPSFWCLHFLKIIMIYKFKTQKENSFIEVKKEQDKAKITVFDDDDSFEIIITKETLYDFIGCLHSVQTKIKKENFDELSNTF